MKQQTLIKITKKVRKMNALHPGNYSACSRCGGNWGWKKSKSHMTNEHAGLFLFCVECDEVVTIEERHIALAEWKKDCMRQTLERPSSFKEIAEIISDIINTEFIEFPRN